MKIKLIILNILFFICIKSLEAENLDLRKTKVEYFRKNNVLFREMKNESGYKVSSSVDDKINNYIKNAIIEDNESVIYSLDKYKQVKQKEKVLKNSKEKKEELKPLVIDTIVKGSYRNIVKKFKEKIGEDEGNQYLSQKERNYFIFKIEIIDAKRDREIDSIEIKTYNRNINPVLLKIAEMLKKNINKIEESKYFYPINMIYNGSLIIPFGSYKDIASGGISAGFGMDMQNYPLPYMILGFDTSVARILDSSDKIDNYNQFKINVNTGFRMVFTDKYFLSVKFGVGYLIHNINGGYYSDPNYSFALENSFYYKENTYMYFAPTYEVFMEKDNTGKFYSIKFGINKLYDF